VVTSPDISVGPFRDLQPTVRAVVAAILGAGLLTAALAVVTVGAEPGPAWAEDNGTGLAPALGWSSWSFLRHDPTAANVEAQARAMATSGLAGVGYRYVNVDDFWYVCPGREGPAVDRWGRWVVNGHSFPPSSSGENGVKVVADYVHHLGLKFGIYVTPGISEQAVAQDTAIMGPNGSPSGYAADEIAEPKVPEFNYNCGGMVGINYQSPGAQDFIDSWADELASWGADYVKLDGVGSFDVPDVEAWSNALRQTGRPIHLELSNALNIHYASTWERYANGWRTTQDIECYACETDGASYPLTDWANVASRFDAAAMWQPYGEPGAFNDYDSIEVGNGSNDGLTGPERQSQLSLWALASSPLILGTDLTHLSPSDLALLENRAVIAVDQDAIDASRVTKTPTTQIFAKREADNDVIVGLFNTGTRAGVISTTASALGLPRAGAYELDDLWSHQSTATTGPIAANVPSHGVALYRVSATRRALSLPPSVVLEVGAVPSPVPAGAPATVTAFFTNNGDRSVSDLNVSLSGPVGWTATPRAVHLADVPGGQTVPARFLVVGPAPSSGQFVATAIFTATASDIAPPLAGFSPGPRGAVPQRSSGTVTVTVTSPVLAPYRTFSSASDDQAGFAQQGHVLEVSSAGTRISDRTDSYSAIYLPRSVAPDMTAAAEVAWQEGMNGYAKAGIMVRNDMARPGASPEGVVLFESPSGGIQMEWDDNGGDYVTSVAPPSGTNPASLPVYLMLQRTSTGSYSGYYSYNGSGWLLVGHAQVPVQSPSEDSGVFVTSPGAGPPGVVSFEGFKVTAGAAPPHSWTAPPPCFSLSCSQAPGPPMS
jgi:hypothetical protein